MVVKLVDGCGRGDFKTGGIFAGGKFSGATLAISRSPAQGTGPIPRHFTDALHTLTETAHKYDSHLSASIGLIWKSSHVTMQSANPYPPDPLNQYPIP